MTDERPELEDGDPRSDDEIRWTVERRLQAEQDQWKRRSERQVRLEKKYGDYSRIPGYLLQPCRTEDCQGLADHMDGRCWRCSTRRARFGHERLKRLPLSARGQRQYTQMGMAIVKKHRCHPIVIEAYNALLFELQFQAPPKPLSWTRVWKRADDIMQAMNLLRVPGQIHPARIVGALVGFMLWLQDCPRYPVDVDDNLLAEWLLSMCKVLDQKERQRIRQRRRFKLALGSHLRQHLLPLAQRIVLVKDEKPRFDKRTWMRNMMRRWRAAKKAEGWTAEEIRAGRRPVGKPTVAYGSLVR
jgi:hypothetical protein